MGSLFPLLIGEILFGISVIRAGSYSKFAAVLFMGGMLVIMLHPVGISESVVDIGATALGVGQSGGVLTSIGWLAYR